jgi:gamma-glutamylcyclotransferase (GGCT)/AIG2-like uncharacterized protein YtfP
MQTVNILTSNREAYQDHSTIYSEGGVDTVGVYGSLREGLPLHGHLDTSNLLGTYRVEGMKLMMGDYAGFPFCIVTQDPTDTAVVEVYSTEAAVIETLDWVESHPSWYRRTLVTTDHRLDTGQYLQFWTYSQTLPQLEEAGINQLVPSGDWTDYVTNGRQ